MRLSMIVLASLVIGATATSAAGSASRDKTEIFSQDPAGSRAKPSALFYGGYPYVLGTTYQATRLRWRTWGAAIARSDGRLKVCPNMAACKRYRVKVAASGLVRNAEGTGRRLYSYVSFTRVGSKRAMLKICLYAEACRLGPV